MAQIANEISTGQIDIGIGAGVESMTMGYGAGAMPERMSDEVSTNSEAADCLLPMGESLPFRYCWKCELLTIRIT